MKNLPNQIVLIGMSGVGKSSIGKQVAQKIKYNFIDTDTYIQTHINQPIQLYIQQNLSQAYSIISMAIIAIPLAIRVGRKESYVNAMLALLIALLYHFLFVYMSWFDEFIQDIPETTFIYIKTNPEVCFDRIQIRARQGEENIELTYLEKCDQYHNDFIHEMKLKITPVGHNLLIEPVPLKDLPQRNR